MRIGYPLSESVAPPGTAWGAEGLRGNEANENNLMVLAPAPTRKGQSSRLLHRRTCLLENLSTQYSVLSTQYLVPRKNCLQPGLGTRYSLLERAALLRHVQRDGE